MRDKTICNYVKNSVDLTQIKVDSKYKKMKIRFNIFICCRISVYSGDIHIFDAF
jgi:hypothetical protein